LERFNGAAVRKSSANVATSESFKVRRAFAVPHRLDGKHEKEPCRFAPKK
jgi:hypothetical protein